ncbi:MAG TPA: outer membrane beta-barrel protein [Polyangia bacterium]|nr:outer membrane beta-barrel protein [Polyangia bacterium]
MKTTSMILTALLTSIALAVPAYAQDFRGADQISGSLGGRVGLHDAEGGGLFAVEYGHRLSNLTWLNMELDMGFGSGRTCFVDSSGRVVCAATGSQQLDALIGARWNFLTSNERLVPYLKLGGGLAFLFWPGFDNDGFAPVGRAAGGLKYFVTPNVGLGGEASLTMGPAIFGCGRDCTTTDLYAAWAMMGGAEIVF